jgi:hypothetical protein
MRMSEQAIDVVRSGTNTSNNTSSGIVGSRLRLFFPRFVGAAARFRGDVTDDFAFLVGGSPFLLVLGPERSERSFSSVSIRVTV